MAKANTIKGPLARIELTAGQHNVALIMRLAGSSLDAEVDAVIADELGSAAACARWVDKFGLSMSKPTATAILRAYGYGGKS